MCFVLKSFGIKVLSESETQHAYRGKKSPVKTLAKNADLRRTNRSASVRAGSTEPVLSIMRVGELEKLTKGIYWQNGIVAVSVSEAATSVSNPARLQALHAIPLPSNSIFNLSVCGPRGSGQRHGEAH